MEILGAVFSFHYAFEALLIAVVIYLLFFRRKPKPVEPKMSERQKDELIDEWTPEPLTPESPQDHPVLNPKFIDGKMGKYVSVDGKKCLNMATSNFLGLIDNERIEEVAKKTIFKYGVGSCGPRGFYGTVDVHLELEKQIAKFMGAEEAVLYSYGFATIASAIPAYAKRGDVVFVDKGCNFAIQKGVQASRSRIEWFNHNDMEDLERLLLIQAAKDKQNPKKAATTRRFIVVEGLYANSGDLCPLPQLMELKWKYKVRIFIDESFSFGVVGTTGRGVTEHYGVDMIDVDMVMASLENAIASTGGFCCGRSFVVGHQRLSGLGYCFSASLPPLLTTAASEALKIMDEEPERFVRLRANSKAVHAGLRKVFDGTKFYVRGDDLSPLQHVHYDGKSEVAEQKLDELVEEMYTNNILLTRARYLNKEEAFPVLPSVRVMATSELSEEELIETLGLLEKTAHLLRHCAQYLESKIGSRSSKQQPQLPLNDSSVIVTLDQQDRKRLEQQRVAEVVSSTCSTERSSAFVATSTKNRVDATAESSVSPVVKRPLLSSAKIAAHHASAAGKLTRNTNAPPPPQNNTPDFQQPMKRSGSPSLLTNDKVSEKGSGDAETEPPLPKLFSKKDLSSLTKSNGKTVIQQPTMNKNPFASPGLIKAFASGGVAQRQDAKATSTPSSGAAKSSNPDGKLMIKKDKKTPASTDKCAVYGLAHNDNQISAEVSSLMNELVQNVSELLEGGMKLNSDGPSNIPRGRRLFNTNRNPVVKTTPFEARKVNKIAILDSSMKFGMLIDRKVRQCGYYSDTFPITAKAVDLLTQGFEAIIISGDMNSSYANEGQIDSQLFTCGLPVLGICQGFHAVNTHFGGRSGKGVIVDEGESIVVMDITSPLFEGLSCTESVYLRKGECIKSDTVAKNFSVISTSPTGYVAGVADAENRIYAVQFHPEHDLTECGVKILKNFLNKICKFPANYDLDYREAKCIYDIQEMMGGNGALVLASGGLLSTVSVKLLQKALGEDRVYPVHVETGLGRLNESEETLKMLKQYGINAIYRDFTKDFLGAEAINDKGRFVWMRGACSPEDKRKLVVESFITVKNKMIKQLGLDYQDTCLSQSTLRSDIIKREFREMLFSDFSEDYIDIPHYNVYHPLQDFYREELQELARKYGFPEHIVNRYSFPSAGLATRIICTEGPYLDCDFELIQERLCWLCDMWRVPVENMQDNPELEETINNLSTDEFSFLRTQDFELEASLVPMKVRGYNGAAKKDSYVVALSTNQEPVPWEFMAFFAKIIPKIIPSITRVVYAFGKKISPNVDDLTESCISRMTVRKLAYADKVANSVLAGYLYDDVPAPGLKDCRDKLKAMPVLLLPVHFDRPEFMFPSRNWSVCLRPVVYSDYATVKPAVPGIDLPEATILKMAERVKSTVPFINRVLLDLTSFPPGTVEWE